MMIMIAMLVIVVFVITHERYIFLIHTIFHDIRTFDTIHRTIFAMFHIWSKRSIRRMKVALQLALDSARFEFTLN